MPGPRLVVFAALSSILLASTLYSVKYNTYLNTSDPLVAGLPHPLAATNYFASKTNQLNVTFLKRAWGWTSAAFVVLWVTTPIPARTEERIHKWLTATGMWIIFTGWFFGPALMERLLTASGGECVATLPGGGVITVPSTYCYMKTAISPDTHPKLFLGPWNIPEGSWKVVPRYYRGHDVSGHIFLLTLSALFLADQLRYSLGLQARSPRHKLAMVATTAVIGLWLFATFTTGVYFHTPYEKFSGYGKSPCSK